MTRKDYIIIARALQGAYPVPENSTPIQAWRGAVGAIADAIAKDNPRFDKDKFLLACQGVE